MSIQNLEREEARVAVEVIAKESISTTVAARARIMIKRKIKRKRIIIRKESIIEAAEVEADQRIINKNNHHLNSSSIMEVEMRIINKLRKRANLDLALMADIKR